MKHQEALNTLDEVDSKFGTLLKRVLNNQLYNGRQYPSFVDYQESPSLREKMEQELSRQSKTDEKCHFCYWYFKSEADKKKHSMFCVG